MKFLRAFICIVVLALQSTHGDARILRGSSILTSARSQFVPNFLASGEYPFLNGFKEASVWNYNNNSGQLKPDELDANGVPLPGANWTTQTGAKTIVPNPKQAYRPGHYVLIWTGAGKFLFGENGSTNTSVSCTGSAGAGPTCDNTGCSSFTGSIAGTTLTVTSAPTGSGCTLGAGVPISGSGVTVSTFSTPTIITSTGSACGPNTCYTVNQSQTVGSATLNIGGRFEVSWTDGSGGAGAALLVLLEATTSGNYAQNFATFHVSDEPAYWASATPCGSGKACIVGSIFKTRIQQANFASMRDLNWSSANATPCTTWATRKPISYISYLQNELRNASSGAGQYVNATGTGASGGTISYNGGTDTYSITLGSGAPVDKQTFLALIPTTGTTTSKISLNGNTAVPILASSGLTLSAAFQSAPTAGNVNTFVYDTVIGGFLKFSSGLNCVLPPEVFIEVAAELNLQPWHVLPNLALDPMTDWTLQYATYIKANYTSKKPIFEVTNEPFNCVVSNAQYLSAKSAVYIAEDAAWTSSTFCGAGPGTNYAEIGKMASTVGQDLTSVFGSGNFEMAVPVQTGTGGTSTANQALQSTSYINQTIAPTQSGYTKTAALTYATRVSVNNYWNTGWFGPNGFAGPEVGVAYCYFNYSISAICQGLYASQTAAMTTYMNTSTTSSLASFNIPSIIGFISGWNSWANGLLLVNKTSPLLMYEGDYNEIMQSADVTQTFTSATDVSQAVLTINNNGCVAGQAIALSALSGGTWSTAAGSYTVQSATTNSCTINLNSTGLGTLTGATITYTGSASYVTFLRQASYLAPEAGTLTTNLYTQILANGGINPSQFNLAAGGVTSSNGQWFVWAPDLYSGPLMGKCTSCTIATTTLTLGGTITGQFRNGDNLFGAGVTGIGTGSGANTVMSGCSTSGSGPCGTNVSDTFTLSNSSTVASGTSMGGYAIPPANGLGNGITSPAKPWGAICAWNGNASAC